MNGFNTRFDRAEIVSRSFFSTVSAILLSAIIGNTAFADAFFDGRELQGVREIYLNNSNLVSVQPTRIDVSRNGYMTTVLNQHVHSGDNTYGLLQFSLDDGLRDYTVPNDSRIGWVSWSNAGAAIYAEDDIKVYFVPWEQAAITVFDRKAVNIGGPAINDSGSIALASRDVTSHPLRDEWLSCAGQTAELLPELNEYRLRNEIAIDGAGRVVGTFEYRTDVATTQKVMRYNSAGTWEKLLDSSNEELVGLIGGQPINYRGDFIYASSLRTDVGVEHWLNLFDSTTNAPRRLVQYSGDIQTVRAKIADTGDALLTIRTPYETDVFRYEADNGTVTDLSTLLPAAHSLALQQLPQMNYKGEVVFGTTSALGYSYFSLDATGENLNRSVLLENLQLQEYALSDFGQLYFWLSTPNEAFLGMVTIPEPSTMLLVFVAACGMVNLRRGKNRHFV